MRPQLTPERGRIGFFEGRWKMTGQQYAGSMGPGGPMRPAGPIQATQVGTPSPGGALMILSASEQRPTGPMEVCTISWYDAPNNEYHLMTDLAGQIINFTGQVTGSTWTYLSEASAGVPAQRFVLTETSPSSFNWTTEMAQPDGSWQLTEQGSASK
jgi:hypothetical protein